MYYFPECNECLCPRCFFFYKHDKGDCKEYIDCDTCLIKLKFKPTPKLKCKYYLDVKKPPLISGEDLDNYKITDITN
jgi:hypothetical protein